MSNTEAGVFLELGTFVHTFEMFISILGSLKFSMAVCTSKKTIKKQWNFSPDLCALCSNIQMCGPL